MDRPSAVSRIYTAAELYRRNLCDRRVLFIPGDRAAPLEVCFGADNFMHLCGVDYPVTSKRRFFAYACERRLNHELLSFRYDRKSEDKLMILATVSCIDSKAMLFSRHPSLPGNTQADCVAVNRNAVIGFKELGEKRVPETALNLERQWENAHSILAIVKTEPHESSYTIISKEPRKRNLDAGRISRILTSMRHYDGDGDLSPAVAHFESVLASVQHD